MAKRHKSDKSFTLRARIGDLIIIYKQCIKADPTNTLYNLYFQTRLRCVPRNLGIAKPIHF